MDEVFRQHTTLPWWEREFNSPRPHVSNLELLANRDPELCTAVGRLLEETNPQANFAGWAFNNYNMKDNMRPERMELEACERGC